MNTRNIAKGLLLGASLLLASSAFAGEKGTVKVYENLKLNGKTLAPGKYQVEWEGAGSDVQLSIRQGKETVATLPAKLITSTVAPLSTGYSTKRDAGGAKTLTSVLFAGKKYTLDFGEEVAANSSKPAETAGNK